EHLTTATTNVPRDGDDVLAGAGGARVKRVWMRVGAESFKEWRNYGNGRCREGEPMVAQSATRRVGYHRPYRGHLGGFYRRPPGPCRRRRDRWSGNPDGRRGMVIASS